MNAPLDEPGREERSVAAWVTISLRVALGLWFVYSGGSKLWVSGLGRFAEDIGNYQLLPPAMAFPAACLVPWLELLAGLCLMLGLWLRGAILVMCGLVAGFSVFILWAWSKQLDIRCGCHGGDETIQYWWKVVELSGYFLVLGWLWVWESQSQKKQNMA